MALDKEAAAFMGRVSALINAQQRMEYEGCPNVMSPDETRYIAESLATVDFARNSAMFGARVRSGAIARADIKASRIAKLNGPRIPGRGNGTT